jgi:hypothetical protein
MASSRAARARRRRCLMMILLSVIALWNVSKDSRSC